MPRFLVTVHRPEGFDPASVDEAMRAEISALNREMVEAGVRQSVAGLTPLAEGALIAAPDAQEQALSGRHIDGFWVLDVADRAAALDWARKASAACRAEIELRQMHG